MAIVVGLVVGLFLLLGFHLLGAGIRNPRWLLVGFCLVPALYKYGEQTRVDGLADVGITAQGSADCPLHHIQVRVMNQKDVPLRGFSFELRGFRPNYSDHVVYGSFQSDRIVGSNQGWTNCWHVEGLADVAPAQVSTLRWEPKLVRVLLD